MEQYTNVYSRKSISNWLKNIPYSQNLNDGVLYCKILQKTNSQFPRFIENPRTQYDNLKNFRTIQKYLQKQGLYQINDVSKFAASKDFFEFSSWLYSYYSKKMDILEPLSESILTINKSMDLGNTSRTQFKDKENVKGSMKQTLGKDKNIDFYEVYQSDVKNLLVLTARKDDVEYLEGMIRDMERIVNEGESIEEIKERVMRRFYGNLAHLL